jgi:Protein of unknown function (DUF3102)
VSLSDIEKRLGKLAEEINQEHQAFRRAFKATFRSALRAGDLLNEAKAQAGYGNWTAWVEENCDFSDRTARVYMRLANNRGRVEEMLGKSAEPADLSIEEVLRELSSPQEHTVRIETIQEPAEEVVYRIPIVLTEGAEKTKPAVDAGKTSMHVTGAEEERRGEQHRQPSKIKIGTQEYTHGEIHNLITELRRDRQEAREDLRRVEEHLEAERSSFSKTVQDNAAKQIADYQARYGIPEIPKIFQIQPEKFQKFLKETTDDRQREAMKLLTDAMTLVGKMMQFEPVEAANGFLRWHDRDRAKEAMQRKMEWLRQCVEEIDAQTTPGRLRVIGKETKKE